MLTAALFLIGILLIAGVMTFFDFSGVVGVILSANMNIVILAVAIQLAMLGLHAVRLTVISEKYNKMGFWDAFRISISGMAVSMITPVAKIGGEPLKIYLLKKRKDMNVSKATAVVAVDTLTELVSSIFVVLAVLILFAGQIPSSLSNSFAVFIIVTGVLTAVTLKVLLNPALMRRVVGWAVDKASRFARLEKKDYVKLFEKAFKLLLKDRRTIIYAFSTSFAAKFLEFARMWLVFVAIGVLLPVEAVIIVWSIILILFLVPWLPGSLGLVEFFGAGAFVLFGVASSAAAAGLLIDRFLSFWLVVFIGLGITTTLSLPKHVRRR